MTGILSIIALISRRHRQPKRSDRIEYYQVKSDYLHPIVHLFEVHKSIII